MSNNNVDYKHIRVGESGCISCQHECASILSECGDPIFEVSVGDYGVEIAEACDYFHTEVMTKADAIAALNELINYIEANTDD